MRAHHLVGHRARQPRIGLKRLLVAPLNGPTKFDVQHLCKFCRRGRIGVSARRNGGTGTAACDHQKQRREHLQGVNGQNCGLKATTNARRIERKGRLMNHTELQRELDRVEGQLFWLDDRFYKITHSDMGLLPGR